MARFLIAVWPVRGHLHPNLAVANELLARGHAVAVYTGEKMRPLVEGEGYRFFPFRRLDEARVDALLEQLGAIALDRRQLLLQRRLWQEWMLETMPGQLADLEPILDAWRPDVLICDPAMWAPYTVLCDARQLPVAILSYLGGCIVPGRDSPLLGVSLPRPRSWPQRLGHALLRGAGALGTSSMRRGVNQLRRAYGLPPLPAPIATYAARMPLYLQHGAVEFDYNRRDLPPSVHYVGLLLWDRPRAEPPPEFLATLPRDRPWVYVTEGTMHFQPPLVARAALRGLADLPIQVILTTSRSRAELGAADLPANVRLERWVPHSDLLPLLDVVVTTGGTGTVLLALQLGIPLVVVPSAWDQPENAWRVVEAGVGIRVDPRRCTPERLRAAVERVLGDPTFRQNAERFSRILARYGGATEAATLLEGLLSRQCLTTESTV